MPEVKDLWYIRLPDGRILRAAGVSVIRQQFTTGRLPPGTRVRRTIDEDWQPVERLAESAPLHHHSNGTTPPPTIASRLDPARLRLAGVRPLVEELLGALDSTACPSKLRAAALAGLSMGALAGLVAVGEVRLPFLMPWLAWGALGLGLLVLSWLGILLARMSFTEVSRLRPADWKDGAEGGFGAIIHLALAQAIVFATLGGSIFGLRLLPTLVPDESGPALAALAQAVAAGSLLLESLVWLAFLLALPLPAIAAIEQGSFVTTLRQALALAWRKAGRLLLAEVLALGIGLVAAAPLGLLGLLIGSRTESIGVEAAVATRSALLGLLAGVFLAYLIVANVFLYLNLRYESGE